MATLQALVDSEYCELHMYEILIVVSERVFMLMQDGRTIMVRILSLTRLAGHLNRTPSSLQRVI
jgi:hypothetical protein